MSRGRDIVRIVWITGLLVLAALVLFVVSQNAGASWSGTPLPPYGNDWNIDQDTVYTGEVIDLNGNINVMSPYTLTLDGCNVTIESNDWDGQYGIHVDWDATLYLTSTSVQNLDGSMTWFFEAYGDTYMSKADLYSLTYFDSESVLEMDKSTVHHVMWGWSMYSDPTTISDSKFYDIGDFESNGKCDMSGSEFHAATSYSYFYNWNDLTLTDCRFYDVYYLYSGGKLTISGCQFKNQGYFNAYSDTSIDTSTFMMNNSQMYFGGAAWLFKDTITGSNNVQLGGSTAYVDSCTIKGTQYGLQVYGAGHVGNTTIDVLYQPDTPYPSDARGLSLYSKAINLDNIAISVNYDYNYTYSQYYWNIYSYVYGVYVADANIGQLTTTNITSITIKHNVAMHDYESDWNVYVSNYMYTYAIYLTGNTVCTAIKDIPISVQESYYGASYDNMGGGIVNYYNFQQYIYSTIGNKGKSPLEVSGLKLKDFGSTFRTGGINVQSRLERYNSYLLYFADDKDSRASDAVLDIHDNTIQNVNVGYMLYLQPNAETEIGYNIIKDSECNYMMYIEQPQKDFRIVHNTFSHVMSIDPRDTGYTARAMVYLYSPKGQVHIANNTFADISGWALFYMTQSADRSFIEGNVFKRCTQSTDDWNPWFMVESNSDKVTIDENTFMANRVTYLMRLGSNSKRIALGPNTFQDNTVTQYLVGVYYNNDEVDIDSNYFGTNTGPLFHFESTYSRVNFVSNTVTDNAAGGSYLMYTYYTYNELRLTDNDFNNNSADGVLLYFNGPTYWYWPGTTAFTVERNTFSDNIAAGGDNGGVILIKAARFDTPIRRNTFEHNTGNCVNFYRPYSYYDYYGYHTQTFTLDGNDFRDNLGACSVWVDFNGYNILVKRNTGTNNAGPLMKVYNEARSVYDYNYPQCVGDMNGANSIDAENNNYSYNAGGAIDIRAQWHDMYTMYTNAEQVVSIRNNILTHNGDDYCIRVVDFGAAVQLHNNDFKGSSYGVFLQAIDYVAIWPRLTLTFDNQSYDGGPMGVTAWALVNVDAEFTNCTFTDYTKALYVKDGKIDVWWSSIQDASGDTEGRGYIYVWNHLEFNVTWSDARGINTGMPAKGATLAMMGLNGRYYGEMLTDQNGHVGPMVIQPWTSIEGKMDAWSPYTVTVMLGGLTGRYTVHAIGELQGEKAVNLVIQDTVAPTVTVTSPTDGAISNLLNMPAEGFLFETGSGVASFKGQLDSKTPVDITPTALWSKVFMGLAPGQHTLTFEVKDLAGNVGTASVTFVTDSNAPSLVITSPNDGLVTNQRTITIQGAYSDDLSDFSEISVRLNGERLDVSGGRILMNYDLAEGVNTILIDATDAAGNRASATLTVTLDTYPPTLYVYAPMDNMLTADGTLLVNGLTDAGTVVYIDLVPSQGGFPRKNATVIARPDGTFTSTLPLYEGSQLIVVTAKDAVNNTRTLSRHVILDTTPPGLFIDTPHSGEYLNRAEVAVVGRIEDINPETVEVTVNGQPIAQNGMFTTTISLVEGPNTITVTATDQVGNTALKTITVTRDTVRPTLIVGVPDYVLTNDKTLVVKGTVNSDTTKLKVAGQDASFDEQGRFSVPVDLSTATSPIKVEATDLAGNTMEYDIFFAYDGEKPSLQVENPPKETSRTYTFVNGTITDDKATITTVKIMGQDFPVIDGRFSALVDLKTTGDGWNNFTVEAKDDAGNTAVRGVSVHYVAPTPEKEKEAGGLSNEQLSWIGLVLLAAGVTLVVTAWFLSNREVDE